MAAKTAHQKYVTGIKQQVVSVAAQAHKLKAAAPKRVAKANKLVAQAGAAGDADAHYHAVARMLNEVAFYPPHDQRKESPLYKKSHDELAVKMDMPCLACGVKQSTLKDASQNPFGAIQMETHHHVIEWALANAIDPAKFNLRVLPGLVRRNPQKYSAYTKAGMTKQQIMDWVDHDEDNLWVLCDVHHRHKFVGIHAITFPIWGPQDLVEAGLVQQDMKQAAAKAAPAKAAAKKKPAKKPAAKKKKRAKKP